MPGNLTSTYEDESTTEVIAKPTLSNIQKFYSGKSIFLTGGSGFVGQMIIEKLLRSCPDLKMIHILMRPKKGKQIDQRFEDIFDCVVFDRLKRENPNFQQQVSLIAGDCCEPQLGLCNDDRQELVNEIDCVIHCAATVRFDQSLRAAVNINVRATRDLLILAEEMHLLQSFVYVSTAFSYCPRKEIDEVFYDTTVISGKKLISVVESLDDDTLNAITPILLGPWPNTYAFTKAVAEGVVKTEGSKLPLVIVRPSMIVSTMNEPIPGWINNFYGPVGLSLGMALGVIRVAPLDNNKLSDMVPVDCVVNCVLAAGWNAAGNLSIENRIYNCVSSPHITVPWERFCSTILKYGPQVPTTKQIWYHKHFLTRNPIIFSVLDFLVHVIPAYFIDLMLLCSGRKTMMVKAYQKIKNFLDVVSYFTLREWHFKDNNTRTLWKSLTEEDKKLFNFDLSTLDFEEYVKNYLIGARVYLLKDPIDTLPQGRAKYRKLKIAYYASCTVLCYLLYLLVSFMVRVISC